MSAGTKTFKVLVSFDAPETPGCATALINVPFVTDKEHAKRVVRLHYGVKLKNMQITRVTEAK